MPQKPDVKSMQVLHFGG